MLTHEIKQLTNKEKIITYKKGYALAQTELLIW